MKTTALTALLFVVLAHSGFAQGQVTFANNLPSLRAPIFGPELDWVNSGGDWANAKTGNTPSGTPAGTQVYNGARLESLVVSFWAAPGIVTDGNLLSQGDVTTSLGVGALAGYFPTTTVTFVGIPISSTATVQVRVTDPSGGLWFGGQSPPGYAAVSSLFTVDVGSLPVVATGLRSFSAGWLDGSTLTPFVPEPTATVLVLTGAVGLVWRRRKTRP